MDATSFRTTLERIDAALTTSTELLIGDGAALLALGFDGRSTVDIDVLPGSRFVAHDLQQACAAAGLAWNPPDKDFPPGDYLEIVPAQTLVLPTPAGEYEVVFRGRRLIVRVPPAADLAVGRRKRLDPEDLADIQFLVTRFAVDEAQLRDAFARLPERFRRDGVLLDNLRYVVEDTWGKP
ncbi:MAG: hypothetical protein WAT39_08160 [Planctomycetota bacterium]